MKTRMAMLMLAAAVWNAWSQQQILRVYRNAYTTNEPSDAYKAIIYYSDARHPLRIVDVGDKARFESDALTNKDSRVIELTNLVVYGTIGVTGKVSSASGVFHGNAAGLTNLPLSGLSASGAVSGDVPRWNGSLWAPARLPEAFVAAGSDGNILVSTNVTSEGTLYTLQANPLFGVNQIVVQNLTVDFDADVAGKLTAQTLAGGTIHGSASGVSNVPPSGIESGGAATGQVLKWNGVEWAPADDLQGSGGGGSSEFVAAGQNVAVTTNVTADGTLYTVSLQDELSVFSLTADDFIQTSGDINAGGLVSGQYAVLSGDLSAANVQASANVQAAGSVIAGTELRVGAGMRLSENLRLIDFGNSDNDSFINVGTERLYITNTLGVRIDSALEVQSAVVTNSLEVKGVIHGNGLGVTNIQPAGIAQGGALSGQVLKWNGSEWVPGDDLQGTAGSSEFVAAGQNILVVTNNTANGTLYTVSTLDTPSFDTVTAADIVAGGIDVSGLGSFSSVEASGNISSSSGAFHGSGAGLTNIPLAGLAQSGASVGQVPQWDGSAWVPATVSGGGGGSQTVALTNAYSDAGSLKMDLQSLGLPATLPRTYVVEIALNGETSIEEPGFAPRVSGDRMVWLLQKLNPAGIVLGANSVHYYTAIMRGLTNDINALPVGGRKVYELVWDSGGWRLANEANTVVQPTTNAQPAEPFYGIASIGVDQSGNRLSAWMPFFWQNPVGWGSHQIWRLQNTGTTLSSGFTTLSLNGGNGAQVRTNTLGDYYAWSVCIWTNGSGPSVGYTHSHNIKNWTKGTYAVVWNIGLNHTNDVRIALAATASSSISDVPANGDSFTQSRLGFVLDNGLWKVWIHDGWPGNTIVSYINLGIPASTNYGGEYSLALTFKDQPNGATGIDWWINGVKVYSVDDISVQMPQNWEDAGATPSVTYTATSGGVTAGMRVYSLQAYERPRRFEPLQ